MAIEHGKMTEGRKEELLVKIQQIADNSTNAYAGVESDIKVNRDDVSGDIEVDLVVHYMASAENEDDRMNVSYAAAKSTIKNATLGQQAKACELLHQIV